MSQEHTTVAVNPAGSLENAIADLREEVRGLAVEISKAGGQPEKEVEPLRLLLGKRAADLQSLLDLVVLTSDGSGLPPGFSSLRSAAKAVNSFVPDGLPLFQWTGLIRDSNRESFPNVEACIRRFEDVLISHEMSLDTDWSRLLPRCLGIDLRNWLNEFVEGQGDAQIPWSAVKKAIISRYGVPREQSRFARIHEFLACTKQDSESIDSFLERFKGLRARSEVSDKHVAALVFFDAFPNSVSRLLTVAMSQASETSFYDIDYMSSVARRLDATIEKKVGNGVDRLGSRKREADASHLPVSNEAKKSRWYEAPSSSGARGASSRRSNSGVRDPWVSKFGKTMAQHRAEQSCKECNGHYGKGHSCATGGSSGPTKTVRMMTKRPTVQSMVDKALASEAGAAVLREKSREVNACSAASSVAASVVAASVPVRDEVSPGLSSVQETENTEVDSDVEMSESDGHTITDAEDLCGRAQASIVDGMDSVSVSDVDLVQNLSAQECKFDAVFSAPPTLRSNAICVPIVVQNVICFGIVDTGATFSCITDEFFDHLGGRTHSGFEAAAADSIVQLAHEATTVPRVGSVVLNVTYNKVVSSHSFEVFTFYSEENVHVLLGMDVLSKIGIGISGLVSQHDFQTGPRKPDPVDDSIEPNHHPFGSDKERAPYVRLLNELLLENSQIDMRNTQCNLPDSVIKLDTKPGCVAYRAQYPLAEAYRDAVNKQIQVWLDEGVIERSASHTRFNHPLLVVKKKDSNGNYDMSKPRVVLDVRKLNSILEVDDKQQLPLISSIHQNIGNKTIHTCLDIHACFTSFGLDPSQAHKVSFTSPFSNTQYTFRKAAYGIRHVGSVVVRTLQNLLSDLNTSNAATPNSTKDDQSVFCYVDDIICSTSGSLENHFKLVAEVIRRLTKANLVLNPEKVVFAQRSIYLLGWSVIDGKLVPDGRKLTNIMQWPPIKTGRQLASFLGLMSYFRSSIPMYSRLTGDLDSLKQCKDLSKVWTARHDRTIANLKDALTNALVMSTPDFSCRFHLATDASLTAIGGLLYQVIQNEIRYIGLVSRKLSPSERNYSTTKRELLGICYSLEKFHRFLYMRRFTLHTDHKSLIYLNTQEIPNALMLGWWENIFSYTFDIVHLPGVLNVIPDALSRLYEDDDASARHLLGGRYYADGGERLKQKRKMGSKLKSTTPTVQMKRIPVRITRVLRKDTSIGDDGLVDVKHSSMKASTSSAASSKQQQELILRTMKFCDYVTPPATERDNMIISQHLVGHFGINHVETAIHHEGFHWTNIRKDIERILGDCIECNKFNIAREGYHPFRSAKADQPLDHWCMDLGDMGVTSSFGSNFIFVMTDIYGRFTVIRCIPDKHATTIARELLQVFSLFGWPKILTSDRGKEFINEVVEAMVEISGIDRRLSLAWNPLGNSVAESWIKLAKSTTVKLLKGKRDQWEHYIPWVNYCLNVKYARLHKSRPYTILFNRQPNGLTDYSKVDLTRSYDVVDQKKIDEKYSFVQNVLIPAISKRILETQKKDHANFAKKHKIIEKPYPVGSKVMVVNENKSNKLDVRYEGPYLINGITSKGSYVLMDRTGNLLSYDVPTHKLVYNAAANATLTSKEDFIREHQEVQAVINHRGSPGKYKYLVQWKGFDEPTWEPIEHFNSTECIELYWGRRNGAKAVGKRKIAPATVNQNKAATRPQKKRGRPAKNRS
ncbi:uncharacterized protein ATC70_001534 [Mucor velutinosus]|uniref:Reverse transcriptase n=1 Tax=Mucor velutinosus TaxID=708070 RepID=A0AAN7I1U4_9FUNG|nr:hypothetical protein ATC70_001534 [Mucor velutinosus]